MDLTIDAEDYKELKKLYENAVENNQVEFTFKEQIFLVSYAKYLLEYLKPKFE